MTKIITDALQKLKIIPKDQDHIDLTDSPPPSPKVKLERGVGAAGCKRTEPHNGKSSGTQDATDGGPPGISRTVPFAGAKIGASDDARTTETQHDRKRKAMQELQEVKLEEERVALAQKRLRLEKELAEMEGSGK